jgi:acyl carrier protein
LVAGLPEIETMLSAARFDYLALRDIPLARVAHEVMTDASLHNLADDASVAELKNLGRQNVGVDFDQLSALAGKYGCALQLSLASGESGLFHAVMSRQPLVVDWSVLFPAMASGDDPGRYANQPSLSQLHASVQRDLLDRLRAQLPDYMVPAHLVVLEHFPLTPNGKIDRKALPAPGMMRSKTGYVAPRNPIEEKLAAIWSDVLKLDKIGVHDNFFESGGNSLLAVQVLSRIGEQFSVRVPVDVLFQSQTIPLISDYISAVHLARETRVAAEDPAENHIRIRI